MNKSFSLAAALALVAVIPFAISAEMATLQYADITKVLSNRTTKVAKKTLSGKMAKLNLKRVNADYFIVDGREDDQLLFSFKNVSSKFQGGMVTTRVVDYINLGGEYDLPTVVLDRCEDGASSAASGSSKTLFAYKGTNEKPEDFDTKPLPASYSGKIRRDRGPGLWIYNLYPLKGKPIRLHFENMAPENMLTFFSDAEDKNLSVVVTGHVGAFDKDLAFDFTKPITFTAGK